MAVNGTGTTSFTDSPFGVGFLFSPQEKKMKTNGIIKARYILNFLRVEVQEELDIVMLNH